MKTKSIKIIADDKYFEGKDTSKLKELIKKANQKHTKEK